MGSRCPGVLLVSLHAHLHTIYEAAKNGLFYLIVRPQLVYFPQAFAQILPTLLSSMQPTTATGAAGHLAVDTRA